MQNRTDECTHLAMTLRDVILQNYSHLLDTPKRKQYKELLLSLNAENVHIVSFKIPGWRSSSELQEVNNLFKRLKSALDTIQKRDYLSITPKVEDLKVVYKWIQTYNIPHFYFQVFFDKVYGISFEKILEVISNPDNEGLDFSVETDVKNQNKTTIKVRSKTGIEVASRVEEPIHKSVRKEMERGRLLFYVTFQGGTAYLDIDNLKHILGITGQF